MFCANVHRREAIIVSVLSHTNSPSKGMSLENVKNLSLGVLDGEISYGFFTIKIDCTADYRH